MTVKGFKKSDILIALAVLILAGIGFLLILAPGGDTVNVTVDGENYAELPLERDAELDIETPYGINHLVISGGEAWVSEADCKNQVCVNTGKISSQGEMIICLPHKVVITIESTR